MVVVACVRMCLCVCVEDGRIWPTYISRDTPIVGVPVGHGDFPEVLRYERLHFLVLVHNKAQSRELAGACGETDGE